MQDYRVAGVRGLAYVCAKKVGLIAATAPDTHGEMPIPFLVAWPNIAGSGLRHPAAQARRDGIL